MRKKLFNYPGAKTRILDELYSNFPKNHHLMKYIEVFGGSGVVLFNKKQSEIEIYNDLDKGLSAIFWCLVNDFERLCFRLQYANHSEPIFQWFKEYNPKTILDLAIQTIYLIQYSFAGQREGIYRKNDVKQQKGRKRSLFHYDIFNNWHTRFKEVQIFSESFETLIPKHSNDELSFFYVDPPYTITKKIKHYELNFTDQDHIKLRDLLANCKGKWLLSYDNVKFIKELYQGFYFKEIAVQYTMKKNQSYTELLIANYPFRKQKTIMEMI